MLREIFKRKTDKKEKEIVTVDDAIEALEELSQKYLKSNQEKLNK